MRISSFTFAGFLLAAASIAGFIEFAVDEASAGVGVTGLTAVLLGWAARADDSLKATGRAVAAGAGASWAMMGILALLLVSSQLRFGEGCECLPASVASIDFAWIAGYVLFFTAVVSALAVPVGFAAGVYVGLARDRGIRLLPAAIALSPLVVMTVVAFDDGGTPAGVAGVLSTLWLAQALRRARDARPQSAEARRPGLVATS